MSAPQTEMIHARAHGLDLLPAEDALAILASGQAEAAAAVQQAVPAIAAAAELAAAQYRQGGRLIYAAAGSSGLMALADALELPGTYGLDLGRVKVLLAGGMAMLTQLQGGPEDDTEAARADMLRAGVTAADCVVALSASGTTPYAIAALEAARAAGARTVAISNNGDVPLFASADVAIYLPTPPEVIAGSTRMGAGTAQKIALNMLSTTMAMLLGHVHDGFMVNVIADNLKLQQRARGMVMAVSGVAEAEAGAALDAAAGDVKLAVLVAAGAHVEQARQLLVEHEGHLRPSLAAVRGPLTIV
ncbi:MAG TPA: N-acetylmuramic acid 6-phosphate etherase [Devosia sp.]|uniref:N-acetylmuramic acid 6-phosphate etherase n=1 Tax=Devosia sp. TaxID=1871048 RepID=UPI002F95E805